MKENYDSSQKTVVRAQLFYWVLEELPRVQQSRWPEPSRPEEGGKSCCDCRGSGNSRTSVANWCAHRGPAERLHGGTRGSRRSPHPQLMGFVIRAPWVVAASFGTEGTGPTGDLGLNSDPVRVLHQKSPRLGILICKICKKAESEQNQSMSKKRLPTCRVLEERGHDKPGRSQGQLSVPQGPGICRAPLRPPGPVRRARGAPCSRLHGAQPGPLWAP